MLYCWMKNCRQNILRSCPFKNATSVKLLNIDIEETLLNICWLRALLRNEESNDFALFRIKQSRYLQLMQNTVGWF
jgi:hypothetical protein